jgi:hypothetical protein
MIVAISSYYSYVNNNLSECSGMGVKITFKITPSQIPGTNSMELSEASCVVIQELPT